jgi:long-chain acyl-CoA synthetase
MGGSQSLPEVHSVEVGVAVAGEGKARRLTSAELPTQGKNGVSDLYSSFAASAKAHPTASCMGKRLKDQSGKLGEFEFISYQTAHEQILTIGAGMAALGLKAGDTMGIYAANSMEWALIALGGFSRGLTCVPVYDTLGDNIVEYEAKHAELKVIFCDQSKLEAVASVMKNCPTVKFVVQIQPLPLWGDISEAVSSKFSDTCKLTDLKKLTEDGVKAPLAPAPPSGEELAFIMYTSGTTGDPKGVCIKHVAIVTGASYCAGLELLPTDRYLSYLPLAHIFETMVEHAIFAKGGSVGFFSGNIKLITEDILALKPTLFVGVPRVYQRFYDGAMAKISEMRPLLAKLISHMLNTEIAAVQEGNKTLYGKILAKLLGAKLHGGCVRIMISGAAPLPIHVQEFLVACCGCSVIQGYGMTENCANATLALLPDARAGHVGPPMPTTEVKLVDVPEMNYVSSNDPPTGEICTRSICNFSGYHKNKEETDKMLEKDGWLHTGDIGRWNKDGTLSIIDRKKNIFKLAQGEYVAAEKIEMALVKSKYIAQPFVYGNSFFPMLVAIIVPDFTTLIPKAKEDGWYEEGMTTEKIAAHPKAIELILSEVKRESKDAKLKTFEVPQQVVLEGIINELAQVRQPHGTLMMSTDCATEGRDPLCHPRTGLLDPERLPHAHVQAQAAAATQKVPGADRRHVRGPRRESGPAQEVVTSLEGPRRRQ